MLVNHVERVVIATPTKCGTKSLEEYYLKQADWRLLHRRHRMNFEGEEYQRIIAVRLPLHRLVSGWQYIKTYDKAWVKMHPVAMQGFAAYVEALLVDRPQGSAPHDGVPCTYSNNNAENAEILGATACLRLEDGYLAHHVNKSRERHDPREVFLSLSPRLKDIVRRWCEPDMEYFYADKRYASDLHT